MTQCCILNNNGDRCKAEVRGLIRIFIDTEMYHTGYDARSEFPASWVLLPACENHIKKYESCYGRDDGAVFPTTYQDDGT
jgi:hypothetical protein